MTSDSERFLERVNVTPTCHYWTGATDKDGYGTFNVNGTKLGAHVYAYTQANGPVPDGMEVDHLCHRRLCVNPQHLEAVSHTDNLARRSDRLLSTPLSDDDSSTNTDAVRAKPWQFAKGYDPRRNTAGRPKKGETLLAYTEKLVTKPRNMQAVAEAKLTRLLDTGSVGNRAWSDYRDTYHGVPKQTLVLQQGEDPLAALYAEIAVLQGKDEKPLYIEGPAVLPGKDDHSPDE